MALWYPHTKACFKLSIVRGTVFAVNKELYYVLGRSRLAEPQQR